MRQESSNDEDDATTHESNSDDDVTDSDATDDDTTDAERAAEAAEAIDEIGVERLTEEIVGAWQEAGMPPFDGEEDSADRDDA
jgi:hypothetical protein